VSDLEHADLWRRMVEVKSAKPVDRAKFVEVRNEIFEIYYSLLLSVAKRQYHRCAGMVEMDALISAGVEGLMQSIERFDPGRNLRFITYALQRIRGAMLDFLRDESANSRLYHRRAKMVDDFQKAAGHRLNDDEVYDHFGFVLRDNSCESLDEPFSDRDKLADTLRGSAKVGEGLADCTYLLVGLNRRERLAVLMYYFDGRTMKEVAFELGVSESRVSQMFTDLLPRMRENFERAA
jgi:RNA polymerase sigma factor FliA